MYSLVQLTKSSKKNSLPLQPQYRSRLSSASTCRLSARRLCERRTDKFMEETWWRRQCYSCYCCFFKLFSALRIRLINRISTRLIFPCMDIFQALSLVSQKIHVHTPHHAAELPLSLGCRWSVDAVLECRTLEKLDFLVAAGDTLRLLFDFNMILNSKSHDLPTHEVVSESAQGP